MGSSYLRHMQNLKVSSQVETGFHINMIIIDETDMWLKEFDWFNTT